MKIKRICKHIIRYLRLKLHIWGIISLTCNDILKLMYGDLLIELFENEEATYLEFHRIVAKHNQGKGYKFQLKYTK